MNRPPPGHQAHLDAMMREHLKLLGELVNARRNELKMSQAEAAAWAGLSRTEMYQIEHGLTDEKITTVFRVCRALRMSVVEVVARLDYLMNHPEDRPPNRGLKSQRGKNTRRSGH
jgi:DNA-binding XRE family transcriptional regulator